MKVADLKRILKQFDDEAYIFIGDPDSHYASRISWTVEESKGLSSFWGKDRKNCVFLLKDGQVGAMCDLDDLDE